MLGLYFDITKQKQMKNALRQNEALLSTIIENIPFEFWAIGADGRYMLLNKISLKHYGNALGRKPGDVFRNDGIFSQWQENICKALRGEPVDGEVTFTFGGEKKFYHNIIAPIRDGKQIRGIVGVNIDITERKNMEDKLSKSREELELRVRERTKDLDAKNQSLEELNAALKVLLKQRDEDKKELEENILLNIRNLIDPYIDKLKKSRLTGEQMTYLKTLETQIQEIVTPFAKKLSDKYIKLSPQEIRTAGLIRDGKTTQEIAEMECISENTVSSHRFHIRKKLGLANKKVNLSIYLQSLP